MKKKILIMVAVSSFLMAGQVLASSISGAGNVEDVYYGDYRGYAVDSVGGATYNLDSISVNIVGNILKATVHGGYFEGWVKDGSEKYHPGAFFLSTDGWQVDGDAGDNYAADQKNAGDWEYAIGFDGIEDYKKTSGGAGLYRVNDGSITAGILRKTGEALYDTSNQASLSQGSWEIASVNGEYALQFEMALSDDFVDAVAKNGRMGFSFSQSCANDMIQGEISVASTNPVPEPATMALFGLGLVGLGGLVRRRSQG